MSVAAQSEPHPGLVPLMAIACGVTVANLYYNQPLLDAIAGDLGVPVSAVSIVSMATQLGYAIGLLLLGPLGDRFDRKSIILMLATCLALALAITAAAPNLPVLVGASAALGLFSTLAQQIVPTAAHLAPEHRRGQVIGKVMGGLLFGILGGRFVAGFLGEAAGWRAVFAISAGAIIVLAAVMAWRLPAVGAATTETYPTLLASVFGLARRHRTLREAGINGGLMFAAFSVFWVALTPLLAGPAFHLDSRAAGLFGLIGAAGAAIAPIAGRTTDRQGSGRVLGLAILAVLAAFTAFAGSERSLIGLAAGTVLLDLGVQAALIANQSRIYAISPAARGRINAFFMTCYFTGGAVGSAFAGFAWAHLGWRGAVCAGLGFAIIAGVIHLRSRRATAAACPT